MFEKVDCVFTLAFVIAQIANRCSNYYIQGSNMDKTTKLMAKQQTGSKAPQSLIHAECEMETWRLKTSMPHLLSHESPPQFTKPEIELSQMKHSCLCRENKPINQSLFAASAICNVSVVSSTSTDVIFKPHTVYSLVLDKTTAMQLIGRHSA